MRIGIMYTDSKLFWSGLTLTLLFCLASCDRPTTSSSSNSMLSASNPAQSASDAEYIDLHTIDDSTIKKMISGIWYKKIKEVTGTSLNLKFSWGESTIDVENALCIDLLGGNSKFFFIDNGYDVEVIRNQANQSEIFLIQVIPNVKDTDIIKIQFLSDGGLLVKFDSEVSTGYTRRLNGTYYKSFPVP